MQQLLDHRGMAIDPATIQAIRQTKSDQYPPTHRVPYSGRTRAGVIMTPDQAMTVSSVWACVRYLTISIAKLHWDLKKEIDGGTEKQESNPVHYLLRYRASNEWSSFQFRETLLYWALRWGNGYAEIERTVGGRPFALWPLEPWRVLVMRDIDTEELFYQYFPQRGGLVNLEARDVFHLRGLGDGPVGLSVMAYAAESIGWAKAAQLFGASFFRQSANPSGIVKMKKELTPEAMALLRAEFNRLYAGPSNSNKTAFLDNEMDYQAISIEQEKAQFVETNQFLLDEVCRWFGVPPHKIYNLLRATFTNIEHQSLEVVGDSLTPWARRFCDEADFKMLGQNRNGLYSCMDFKEILMADMAGRMAFYQGLRNIGALNANEIRTSEEMNAIPEDEGGEKYTLQSGMTTLDQIGQVDKALNAVDPAGNRGGGQTTEPGDTGDSETDTSDTGEPAEQDPNVNDRWRAQGVLETKIDELEGRLGRVAAKDRESRQGQDTGATKEAAEAIAY